MQNSKVTMETLRRRSKCLTLGVSHSREDAGFSNVKAMPSDKASNITETENRMYRLPSITLMWSPERRFGKPITNSLLRRGGGPGCRSLAREKVLHGVPKWPALTRPHRIHPMIFRLLSTRRRSYCSPKQISHNRVGHRFHLATARPKRPEPEKISKNTGVVMLNCTLLFSAPAAGSCLGCRRLGWMLFGLARAVRRTPASTVPLSGTS